MSNSTNPNDLYEKASTNNNYDIDFWGEVPRSYYDAVNIARNRYTPRNLDSIDQQKNLSSLKTILRDYHKKLGIYSTKVDKNIDRLDQGSVLVGQQPVLMGGPGFIGNKLACLINLTGICQEFDLDLAPVFFVGDYDGLQKELARQYFPNPISHNAFIIDSEDYLPEESEIAAHAATVPPSTWINRYLSKLEENLGGFKSQVKGDKKKLLDERWAHVKTLLNTTLRQSETLSEWSTRLWGTITNVISDYGIIYLPTSHPEIRKLIVPSYLPFIRQNSTYVNTFQNAIDHLHEKGYEPSLPHRHNDYSPFTLECVEDNNRIPTTIVDKDGSKFAEGECPECGKYYSYDVTTEEDIEEIATIIGPRVDTSQAVFQELMNIQIRISGPGEIAYYAQAAPAVKSIGFNLPIFVKYTRAFYNATWIENLGKELHKRKQGSLQQKDLFMLLRKRTNAIKEENTDKIIEAEVEMKEFIQQQYDKLLESTNSTDVEKYLGWQYGRFTPEKFGQEVSWIWFDMCLQTGLNDYIDSYLRMYTHHSSVGGYFYINSLL